MRRYFCFRRGKKSAHSPRSEMIFKQSIKQKEQVEMVKLLFKRSLVIKSWLCRELQISTKCST